MPFSAAAVAYCTVGGLVAYSGIKGATLVDTVKAAFTGNLNVSDTETVAFGTTPASGSTPSGSTPSGTIPSGAAGQMLSFMESQKGKPYSENTAIDPATGEEYRFGPSEYDCSGLVYAAAHQAGIQLPASQAIASLEAEWFAALKGSTTFKSASQAQVADLCFFVGAAPNPSSFGGIGHVGMCSSPGTLFSAYDTQSGVTYTPMSQDQFVVGVRLA
jgi:cell wall-associated NlpC family hydrolase